MPLKDNLIAYWKLDESSGNAADSVGSRTLTNTDVTYTTGKISNGAVFDGDSAKLVRSAEDLGITNAWTFTCWVKPAAADMANKNILDIRPNTGGANYIGIQGAANMTVTALFYNSAGSLVKAYKTSNNALSNGNWTFVCLSWDGTNFNIYINGSADNAVKSTDNSGTMTNTSRNLYIGVEAGSLNWWNGIIDEVGIWSRALTPSEITALYNSGNGLSYEGFGGNFGEYLGAGSGITKGLWHLNGNSTDSSGNGNNGTDTDITYGLAYGKFGQGALFNGANSVIKMADSADWYFAGNPFTISLWYKQTNSGAYDTLVCQYNSTPNSGYVWKLDLGAGGTKPRFVIVSGGVTKAEYSTAADQTFTSGVWYNIILVRNGTSVFIYKDGLSVSLTETTAISTNEVPNLSGTLNLGTDILNAGRFVDGSIDEVIIENVAWSAEKVKKHFTYSKGRFGII